MKLIRTIEYPKFITHVKMSDRRNAKYDKDGNITNPRAAGTPRYMKINSQNIYSGNMSPLMRQKFVKSMKHYLLPGIMAQAKPLQPNDFPIIIRAEAHVPENYGQAMVRGGEFKYPDKDPKYVPNWDIGNLGYLWTKTFDDCLTMDEDFNGNPITPVIPDDCITYVKGTGEMVYEEVKSFKDRKLVFNIYSV